MHQNPLVGTWRLVSWQNRGAAGEITFPLGPDAVGFLTYTPDGYVFVALMRVGRPAFAASDLLAGSSGERAAAAAGYVSYAGTYELRADRVVHHVAASLFPNWVGTDQERLVGWDGGRLLLSTAPAALGGQQTAHLVWERAGRGIGNGRRRQR
jgi:hypothetical protein